MGGRSLNICEDVNFNKIAEQVETSTQDLGLYFGWHGSGSLISKVPKKCTTLKMIEIWSNYSRSKASKVSKNVKKTSICCFFFIRLISIPSNIRSRLIPHLRHHQNDLRVGNAQALHRVIEGQGLGLTGRFLALPSLDVKYVNDHKERVFEKNVYMLCIIYIYIDILSL